MKTNEDRKIYSPLNINTYDNHYIRLNECDDIRKMLKTNYTGKAHIKAAIG